MSTFINSNSKIIEIKKGLLVGEQLKINPLEIYNWKVFSVENFASFKSMRKT